MTTISGTQQIIAQSEMFCYIDSCRFQVAADVLPDRIGKGVRLRFSIPRARLIVDNAAVEGQIHGHHEETGFLLRGRLRGSPRSHKPRQLGSTPSPATIYQPSRD